jgi:hypothetical protein
MRLLGLLSPLLAVVPVFAQGYLSALETNKKVVFDFYRLVVEPRNADLVDLYVADDFLEHDPTDQKGTASVVKMLEVDPISWTNFRPFLDGAAG